MQAPRSDAIVVFGVTGDLVHKEILPAIYGLFRDEGVSVPVIGVARSDWTQEQLVARARESVEARGVAVDEKVFARLAQNLRYVRGDYGAPETYREDVRRAAGHRLAPLLHGHPPERLPRGHQLARLVRLQPQRPGAGREAVRPRPAAPPSNSTPSCARTTRRRPSSASTTSWARSRSRTSPTPASPTRCWSPSGIASTCGASR